jgi:TonB family protein
MRRAIFVSAFAHGLVVAALLWMPTPEPAALPGVVTVDLVSMSLPASAGKAAPPPKPARAKPVPPAPAPEVKPVPPAPTVAEVPKPEAPKPEPPQPKPEPPKPPPPPPPRNEAVIPKTPEKEPEKPKEKPEPEPEPRVEPKPPPKEVAKAEPPKPAAKPPPPKPQPKPQESYDDVLAELRAERGESRPDRVERPTRTASAATPGTGGSAPRPGAPAAGTASVTPEVAAWLRAARLHVSQAWVVPAGFRNEPLETQIEVELDAQGRVLSEPRVVRRSGNPWYDESVVRAIQKASPLPPPPEPGKWPFVFKPEDLG